MIDLLTLHKIQKYIYNLNYKNVEKMLFSKKNVLEKHARVKMYMLDDTKKY